MNTRLTLRDATIRDADLLLRWRNDPQTRAASLRTSEVAEEEHMDWLTSVLSDVDRELLVAEEDGCPVGTVRADFSDGAWDLSWTVSPSARGRGVAKRMVALLAQRIDESIRAEVRADNRASARVAEFAGMTLDKEANGIRYYRRGPRAREDQTRP